MRDHGFFYLRQIINPTVSTLFSQGWISIQYLNLQGEWVVVQNMYLEALKYAHIWIRNSEDEFIWDSDRAWVYTPKVS